MRAEELSAPGAGQWGQFESQTGVPNHKLNYLANARARAALTSSECGACRDWTR